MGSLCLMGGYPVRYGYAGRRVRGGVGGQSRELRVGVAGGGHGCIQGACDSRRGARAHTVG
eukprot:4690082-Pleurochrysis_carterae.AAC.1